MMDWDFFILRAVDDEDRSRDFVDEIDVGKYIEEICFLHRSENSDTGQQRTVYGDGEVFG